MMGWMNSINLAEAQSLIPSHHNLTYHLVVIVISAIAAFVPRYFPMRFFTNRIHHSHSVTSISSQMLRR